MPVSESDFLAAILLLLLQSYADSYGGHLTVISLGSLE